MHKLIIVGHPQSGYEEVEHLLKGYGMGDALPTPREGLLPIQIAETICNAHTVAPISDVESDEQIQQIGNSPIWRDLARDLVLGNLDQRFWGWSDPNSLYLLDYWNDLDASFKFVFTYQHPASVVLNHADRLVDDRSLRKRINNWCAFNNAVLQFYRRNRDSCLLAHANQVSQSVDAYLEQLSTLLGEPTSESRTPLPPIRSTESDYVAPDQQIELSSAEASSGRVLEQFLAEKLIEEYPHAQQIYERLEAVADLPFFKKSGFRHSGLDAWIALTAEKLRLTQLEEQLRDATDRATAREGVQQENELLLAQLQDVQDELELYVRRRRKNKKALLAADKQLTAATRELAAANQEIDDLRRHYDIYQALTQRLFFRVSMTMAEHSRSLYGWLTMPWRLMRVLRQHRSENKNDAKQSEPVRR
jgi:hypothetical protein